MSNKIEDIEGIGPAYAEKLRAADIQTTDDLLRRCGSKKGREGVATETGISETHILEWTNLADLMRLSGVGEEYADLLEEAGVDTVKELKNRNATNLAAAMLEVNEKKNLVNRVPSAETVQKWIDEAGELEPMVSH
jgi:predicted flap endonuclease-1-like 5' DNA nuclease